MIFCRKPIGIVDRDVQCVETLNYCNCQLMTTSSSFVYDNTNTKSGFISERF